MAVRAAVQYIAHYVIRELGLGCYVPASVAAAATSMRVLDSRLFDRLGGTIFVEDIDNLITYTGIDRDTLTGIPASSTGSISATINPYTNASRDLVWRCDLLNSYELELMIDRFRRRIEGEKMIRDVTRKLHRSIRGWYDTGVELRDANDDSYSAVVADTINYETGTFDFSSARDVSEQLYLFGYGYNPYAVIGEFLESFAQDDRWNTYSQIGQTARSKESLRDMANQWRARGTFL